MFLGMLTQHELKNKDFFAFKPSDVVFIMFINVKVHTFVGF